MEINGTEYVVGQDRNDEELVAHLYKGTFSDPGLPMCVRGWNRSGGDSYSIFRNVNMGIGRKCKVCLRRATEGKDGVPSRKRKTKWI